MTVKHKRITRQYLIIDYRTEICTVLKNLLILKKNQNKNNLLNILQNMSYFKDK